MAAACLKHFNFFTVKDALQTRPVRAAPSTRAKGGEAVRQAAQPSPPQKFNYELFNCNNFNIHYWSWNYRGCWHQTCPPIVPR